MTHWNVFFCFACAKIKNLKRHPLFSTKTRNFAIFNRVIPTCIFKKQKQLIELQWLRNVCLLLCPEKVDGGNRLSKLLRGAVKSQQRKT